MCLLIWECVADKDMQIQIEACVASERHANKNRGTQCIVWRLPLSWNAACCLPVSPLRWQKISTKSEREKVMHHMSPEPRPLFPFEGKPLFAKTHKIIFWKRRGGSNTLWEFSKISSILANRGFPNRAYESMWQVGNNLSEVATVLESSPLSDFLASCILFTLSSSSCNIGAISMILQDGL